MISSSLIKKWKPLTSSLDSLSHQLLQRCSVSGTAKGKAKIKAGQPLKRSKVTTKKGSGSGSGSKDGPRRRTEFDETVDQCLTAVPPLRHLKPKDRVREAEREKMGLVSIANEQAKKMLKKQGAEFDKPLIMGTLDMDFITLRLVDGDKVPKYELTVEDGRRLAKEYSRVLMRKHRARQAAESTLLRLKREAVEALPEGLKVAASVPDLSPVLIHGYMATLTPPIEGHMDRINEAARKNVGSKKMR